MDEATRLFAERGYEGTSMADLAERVGLRKASLFHHFASKEQLRRAVLERLVSGVTASLAAAATERRDPNAKSGDAFAAQLDALTDAVVALLGKQPYAARLIVREAMEWDAASKDTLSEAFTESLRAGETFLAASQEAGLAAPGDPKHFVATLLGLHILPFAFGGTMERFTGVPPWSEPFIEARRAAVRQQVRALLLPR